MENTTKQASDLNSVYMLVSSLLLASHKTGNEQPFQPLLQMLGIENISTLILAPNLSHNNLNALKVSNSHISLSNFSVHNLQHYISYISLLHLSFIIPQQLLQYLYGFKCNRSFYQNHGNFSFQVGHTLSQSKSQNKNLSLRLGKYRPFYFSIYQSCLLSHRSSLACNLKIHLAFSTAIREQVTCSIDFAIHQQLKLSIHRSRVFHQTQHF